MPGYLRESCSSAAWTVVAFSTATSPWLAVSGRSGAGIFTVTGMASAPPLVRCRAAAGGAGRIALELQRAVRAAACVPSVQDSSLGSAAQHPDGSLGHCRADQAAERCQHAGVRAG